MLVGTEMMFAHGYQCMLPVGLTISNNSNATLHSLSIDRMGLTPIRKY